MEPISREEAKARGLRYYFTGKPCKHGHVVERLVHNKNCMECRRLCNGPNLKKWRRANPEHWKNYIRDWRQQYPERVLADRNRRRAAELQALPSWVRTSEIWPFHKECRRISKETGVQHHVDHIVPLAHPHVCGLHVPWNLQIITAAENNAKRNEHVFTSSGASDTLMTLP
jgi:hypothetical protein